MINLKSLRGRGIVNVKIVERYSNCDIRNCKNDKKKNFVSLIVESVKAKVCNIIVTGKGYRTI